MLTPREARDRLVHASPELIRAVFSRMILTELIADPEWERGLHQITGLYP